MNSQNVRRQFLNYFKGKGHAIVPSSPVVPHDDPTLLFTNAGMNQFKDVFLGKSKRDYKRATTSQKCIRVGGKHNDLDNVGHTARHLTFFEMLGNFSFGDYFKKEAIAFAWEVTTQIFDFSPEKLWITVYEEDDEAFELWLKHVKAERIVRMGKKDNFWAMGETGPCGPCSELYFDRGVNYGSARNPKEDATGERYMEFWNLVFMQFNCDAGGQLNNLPNQSIDTGAGLERVMSLKMNVDNVFHTDILRHLMRRIEEVSGVSYDTADKRASAFHVIADHLRSLSFAIADGAQPSNVERGYVLRKLLRRAVRYGRSLNLQEPFMALLLPSLVDVMGSDYPELITAKDRIAEVLTIEEESFLRTLKRGGNILTSIVEKAVHNPLKQISGEEAFKLKDTYGFPLEEILLIAKDAGLQVNIDAYQILEEEAKEKSRSAQVVHTQEAEKNLFASFVKEHGACAFVGYADVKVETSLVAIVKEGQFVDSLVSGEEGFLLLKETTFYAEKGGQIGDTGLISHGKGRFKVRDTQSPYPGVILHKGIVQEGELAVGEEVVAHVDEKRRQLIASHHTATHLLHWALQQVLGSHIRQAGSLVEPGRLRFDFSHHKAVSLEEIQRIEDLVNEKIRENKSVSTYEISFEEAQKRGEIKQFFGEKYGAHVRVVDLDYSKELCGGTHAFHVGMLGYFRILKESSIAAGVRRIEAACGKAAEEFVRSEEAKIQEMAALLKVVPAKLSEKMHQLLEENTHAKQELRAVKRIVLKTLAESLVKKAEKKATFSLIIEKVSIDSEDLLLLVEEIFSLMKGSLALVLGLEQAEQAQLFIKFSSDLVSKGLHAGSLIKQLAPLIGGGGGGRPESAQAGGKDPSGIPEALQKAKQLICSS